MKYVKAVFQLVAILALPYVSIASAIFSFRNPTANDMALFREPVAVLTCAKLDKYQVGGVE